MSDRHPLGLVLGTEPRAGFAVAATVPAQRLVLQRTAPLLPSTG